MARHDSETAHGFARLVSGSSPDPPPQAGQLLEQGSLRPQLTRLQPAPRTIPKVIGHTCDSATMTAPPKELFIGALILIGLGIVIALF
jgi:hypothetical protein